MRGDEDVRRLEGRVVVGEDSLDQEPVALGVEADASSEEVLTRVGIARARGLIAGMKGATLPRLLTGYLLLRQITAALGLTSVAGQAQTVRPLLAPMALAAAEPADEDDAERVKAMAAATDNVGLFFGEDIFIAIGSILLMKGYLEQQGMVLAPFDLSVWAIPTAFAAFAIHALRLWRFGRGARR